MGCKFLLSVLLLGVTVEVALSQGRNTRVDPSYLVGMRLRNAHKGGHKGRPFELGAGIYTEFDIMQKVPHPANGISLSYDAFSRWPNAIVPYVIQGTFTASGLSIIQAAMQRFADTTCVRFVPRTTQALYITITNTDTGCWSYVGRANTNTYNQVNLQSPECVDVGTAIHELMHSIGFYHEFTRPDRDSYISIDRSAMAAQYNTDKFYNDNFGKMSSNQVVLYGIPYDYGSVMHYSKYAAAASRAKPVMNNLQPWTGDFGNDFDFAASDIKAINYMYCNSSKLVVPTTTTTTTTKPTTTTTKPTTTTTKPTTTTTTTKATTTTTTTKKPTTVQTMIIALAAASSSTSTTSTAASTTTTTSATTTTTTTTKAPTTTRTATIAGSTFGPIVIPILVGGYWTGTRPPYRHDRRHRFAPSNGYNNHS